MRQTVRRNIKDYRKSIKEISLEVRGWPDWKKNLSALGSNYCSELQPFLDEHSSTKRKKK